ncbi:DUF624 domain-containing protein [Cellulosimicrobium terreum]|nr:DUF624 domain-containing protein [Cellulosimicrobium terreum]
MFSFEGFVRLNTYLTGAYKLVYLNLLWVVTTLLGLVVLGVGPASYALARYVDRWFRLGEEPPITRAFFAAVHERFWQSVVVGWIYLAAGAVIVTNVFGASSWYVQALNVVALVVYAVSSFYVFSVMAATRYRTIRETVAASVLIGFGSLHLTALGGTAVIAATYLMTRYALPVLGLLGVALPAAAVGLVTRAVYKELEEEGSTTTPRPQTHHLATEPDLAKEPAAVPTGAAPPTSTITSATTRVS